jgi:hypothetical protein
MPTFEYDRRYIEWGLSILESYLLSKTAYWPVDVVAPSGEPAYPRFTLEGLLLSLQRLQAHGEQLGQHSYIAKYNLELEFVRNRWKAAWESKAKSGFVARLRMWQGYLKEYREQPDNHADRYRYEVRLRVFLDLLRLNISSQDSGLSNSLLVPDSFLITILSRSDFIWDKEIIGGFPENVYWYLYGKLPYTLPSGDAISSRIARGSE